MMLLRLLPIMLILFTSKIQAMEFPIEVIEYIDNSRVVAFINESDIDKTLSWTPFTSAPPLSLNSALGLIQKYATSDLKLNNATLSEIELRQIPKHKNYWHYLVKMQASVDEKMRNYYFIVLMNGKIISGIREPQSIK